MAFSAGGNMSNSRPPPTADFKTPVTVTKRRRGSIFEFGELLCGDLSPKISKKKHLAGL
jgi:hypothetical protein